MSAPSLPDILARLANATPGPWYRVPFDECPDGAYTDRLVGAHNDGGVVFIADAETDADATLIANAPADLAALAARVAELEAENAAQRATLADPRVAAVVAKLFDAEAESAARIAGHPDRDALAARLAVLADGKAHPVGNWGIEAELFGVGAIDSISKGETVAPSAARVLARLTSEPTP